MLVYFILHFMPIDPSKCCRLTFKLLFDTTTPRPHQSCMRMWNLSQSKELCSQEFFFSCQWLQQNIHTSWDNSNNTAFPKRVCELQIGQSYVEKTLTSPHFWFAWNRFSAGGKSLFKRGFHSPISSQESKNYLYGGHSGFKCAIYYSTLLNLACYCWKANAANSVLCLTCTQEHTKQLIFKTVRGVCSFNLLEIASHLDVNH